MRRYIDADALKEKIFPIGMVADGNYGINAKAIKVAIDNQPTADVVEVKHGTWLRETDKGVGYAKCSACGGTMSIFCYGHDYCPRCGAKMDEKKVR